MDNTNMGLYRGTKELKAWPMTRGEYNDYRGWDKPADEDANEAGYLVEYLDGGKANDERHSGYISWSPADVFERTYYRTDTNTCSQGIAADESWRERDDRKFSVDMATRGEAAGWPTEMVLERAKAIYDFVQPVQPPASESEA